MSKHILTGIDRLAQDNFAALRGLRVGLVTNPTGRTQSGASTLDTLFHAPGVHLASVFGPEHGVRGLLDQPLVEDNVDGATGLPVYSLYGARTMPTRLQMEPIDALVVDIQDIGTRFYTYISTLLKVMEAASDEGIGVVVLDRPNPITGTRREGPLPDMDKLTFTACHRIPIRHGLTMGELAKLMHAERGLRCPLTVIKCDGWRRGQWFDETGLTWVNPSPNMRSPVAALLYPGVGLLEFTNVTVGRTTDWPFEVVGAPWLDGPLLAEFISGQTIAGLDVVPMEFVPQGSVHAGAACGGVRLTVTDRDAFDAVRLGITLAIGLRGLFGRDWQAEKFVTLTANKRTFNGVLSGASYEQIAAAWGDELLDFERRIGPHLLYE